MLSGAIVRPGEARALRLSFLAFFLLTSAIALLRPVREAWGLEAGLERLPAMFVATFVLTLLIVPLYSRLVARSERRRIVPLVMHAIAASLLLFHLALRFGLWRSLAGMAFFSWYSTLNLIIVAAFWSLMADVFRSEQGRRLFGYIAGGGSAGFIVGPLVAGQLGERIGIANLLLVSVALLEGVAICVHVLLARRRDDEPVAAGPAVPGDERLGGSIWAGFTAVARKPYLRLIAVQMLLTTSAATVLYLIQATIVARAASGTEQRLAIFANIDVWTNVASLAVQFLATGPLLLRWGAGVPLRIAAGLLAVSLLLLARWPSISMLKAVQALRRASHYSLERPALNLLFTVVSTEDKYKAKNFTDTVVYRAGDAGAAQLMALIGFATLATPVTCLLTLPLAAGGLWLAGTLSRRHQMQERELRLPLETAAGLRDPAAKERPA
jgi:AAA family ATP:ADP antiporter